MPNENEEQNVAEFRQKVCMYLMTSICICKLASTMMQDFVFNGTCVQYSAEAMDAHRATRQCASFIVTCVQIHSCMQGKHCGSLFIWCQ